MAFYTIRSERQLMEQIDCNLFSRLMARRYEKVKMILAL